ncbi:hypothetical protein [Chromobacterium phragmitis]|uniref:hypothetical protein n=1 Tax=Chromobacterium phragmitis TaxID=2202141 RepID=UPI0011AEA371|nr:hypothetical protein [Chromobacterium phragmitis]
MLHVRLKEELARLALKPVAAAKAIGEPDSQGLRDVLGGRKRLSAELLAALATTGVDVAYVLTGQRQGQGIGESAVHQAVLDAVDLLSLEKKVDANQLAKAVVKLAAKAVAASIPEPAPKSAKISVGGNFHGQVLEGDVTNNVFGSMNIGGMTKEK